MNKKYLAASLLVLSFCVHAMEKEVVVNPESWNAEEYAKNSSPQFRAAMKVLDHIKFQDTNNVLDIGCGDGKITQVIADKVPLGMVKGIDPSFSMIDLASKKYADVKNLFFEHASITKYTSEQKYHYALAFSSFAWIKEQQQALHNIAALLEPGGFFVGGLAHKEGPYIRARFDIMKSDKWKDCFEGYEIPYYPLTQDMIEKLCEVAGLRVVIVDKRGSTSRFEHRKDFIKFMQALPIQIDKVPADRQEEFLNDIIDDYTREVPQNDDGSINLTLSGLLVIAQK